MKTVILSLFVVSHRANAWIQYNRADRLAHSSTYVFALSDNYLESDLVAVKLEKDAANSRLCVVKPDNTVVPLCQHEDDVETDLFIDPRCYDEDYWEKVEDEMVVRSYGEGWYGQRPVPSLGGGPGYGAEAQEIWSVEEDLLEQLEEENVDLPILDMGIAHGEKARGGAF
ncbi:MAG: hypothetical protein SGBAC_001065 [Bacillariaceae sp.]